MTKVEYDKPVIIIDDVEVTLAELVKYEGDWTDVIQWHEDGSITDEEFERVRHFFSLKDGQVIGDQPFHEGWPSFWQST